MRQVRLGFSVAGGVYAGSNWSRVSVRTSLDEASLIGQLAGWALEILAHAFQPRLQGLHGVWGDGMISEILALPWRILVTFINSISAGLRKCFIQLFYLPWLG